MSNTNAKRLLLISILFCFQMRAEDQPKTYQIGVIPGLNASVKVAYRDWSRSQFGFLDKTFLTGSALLHGTLAYTSTATNMRTRLVQHALLWAGSHGIGASQAFFHELSHTIVNHARGANDLEIEIWGGYITLITGIYDGYASGRIKLPSMNTKRLPQKEDRLEYIDAYDKHQYGKITSILAGPVGGTLSGYGTFKLIQKKYPAVFKNRWFKRISLAVIFGQEMINFAPLHPTMDGPRAYQAWRQRSAVLKTREEVKDLREK